MSAKIDYKTKYMALRSKYMNDLDMAFRLGFEQGQQQAQNEQVMEAQAQQQQMELAQAQAMAGGGEPGQPGQPGEGGPEQGAPGQPGEDPNAQEQPGAEMAGQGGSELDQHISQLEQMIAKSEALAKDPEIMKSLENLKAIRKAELQAIELKKSEKAIKGIVEALHKPKFKMSAQANHNLNSNAKQAVSMQHKIVNDVMAKMAEEEKRASKDIQNILNIEGITTKE